MNAERHFEAWLHIDLVCQRRGLSKNTVKGWIGRHWQKGIHYQVIGHQTLINTVELDKWVSDFGRPESTQVGQGSESGSTGAGRSSIKKRSQETPILRVTSPLRNVAGKS